MQLFSQHTQNPFCILIIDHSIACWLKSPTDSRLDEALMDASQGYHTVTPSRSVAFIPTSELSSTVQAWIVAEWPARYQHAINAMLAKHC